MKPNKSIKYGLMAGAGTVGYMLLFYVVSPRVMLSSWVLWSSLIIYIFFMFKACREEKEVLEGEYGFKEALKTAFVVYIMANVVYYSFYYVLFNMADPGLVEVQRELMIENMEKMGKVLAQADLEERIRQMQDEDLTLTFNKAFFSFGWSLIGGFILSLVVSTVARRA